MKPSERIASRFLLFGGVALLWWGANWRVALGGYFLACWAFGKQEDAWKMFASKLTAPAQNEKPA